MKSLDDLGLAPSSIVLLDSAPLIYLVEGGTAARASVLESFLEAARLGRIGLAASTLLWTEVLARPRAREEAGLASAYRRILAESGLVVLVPLDVAIAEEAAGLLGQGGLALADAIHLATARIIGAGAILTNDEAWKGRVGGRGKDQGRARVLLVDELAWS